MVNRRYRFIAVILNLIMTLSLFSIQVYADEPSTPNSTTSNSQEDNTIEGKYKEAQQAIENSNLPEELKRRMIEHNKSLYNLSKTAYVDPKLFVKPKNANEKPINVELSLKYNTFVYGEPTGPHPLMVGKTNEPWLLALT